MYIAKQTGDINFVARLNLYALNPRIFASKPERSLAFLKKLSIILMYYNSNATERKLCDVNTILDNWKALRPITKEDEK